MKEYILEIKKLITENHCEKVISYFNRDLGSARIVGGVDKSIRNCDGSSVLHPQSFGEKIVSNFVKEKIFNCVDVYKKKYPYLNVDKISSCELLRYDHNEYKAGYKFHTDFGDTVSSRHLSISICLNNDFQGGEFF